MPCSARYCSKCLIRPLSKATLFLRQFVLLVFTSFLSSLPPSRPLRGPRGSALGVASRMSFRHCFLYSGPYQTTALQEIPIDSANCASPRLDSWAQSSLDSQLTCMVGLSFLLQMILGRDSMRSLISLSLSLSLLNLISSSISSIYNSKLVGGS